jgi:hypothetical protein
MASSLQLPRNLRRFADREGTPRPVRSVRLIAQAGVFLPPSGDFCRFEQALKKGAGPIVDTWFLACTRPGDIEDFDMVMGDPSRYLGNGSCFVG